jgi:regulatory protein
VDSSADVHAGQDPRELARKIVLRRLDAAPRTRFELSTYLEARGIPDGIITEVLDRFGDVGLVDDALFARMWAESRHVHRGQSRHVIRQDLRRKGVDDQVIADALDSISDDRERERARTLVERKLSSLARFDPPVIERRLVGMLARKGYPTGVCFSVVREAMAQRAEGLSDSLRNANVDEWQHDPVDDV